MAERAFLINLSEILLTNSTSNMDQTGYPTWKEDKFISLPKKGSNSLIQPSLIIPTQKYFKISLLIYYLGKFVRHNLTQTDFKWDMAVYWLLLQLLRTYLDNCWTKGLIFWFHTKILNSGSHDLALLSLYIFWGNERSVFIWHVNCKGP